MKTIFINGWDMVLLRHVLSAYGENQPTERQYAVFLADELADSTVIVSDDVPPDVVRLNSQVCLKDMTANKEKIYRLVLPQDARGQEDHVSVLAPLGAAILGRRVGEDIEVKAPSGLRRFRLEEVWHFDGKILSNRRGRAPHGYRQQNA